MVVDVGWQRLRIRAVDFFSWHLDDVDRLQDSYMEWVEVMLGVARLMLM